MRNGRLLAGRRVLIRLGWVFLLQILLLSSLVWVAGAQRTLPEEKPEVESLRPPSSSIDPGLRLKIEPALLKQLMGNQGDLVPIIVEVRGTTDLAIALAEPDLAQRRQTAISALQATAQNSQGGALSVLSERETLGKAANVRSFWIFNGLAADADLDTVLALAARPEVRIVRQDREYRIDDQPQAAPDAVPDGQIAQWNITQIRANLVWNALKVNGAGAVVANIDTGVDFLHPALHTRYRGYDPHGLHLHACNWFDATGGATYPVDGNGHGTHTMGTIAGGEGIGVAPGATWIAVRAFNSQGMGLESWLHAAMQWMVDPGPGCTPPDVVSNSWSSSWGGTDVFRSDVQAMRAAGIFAPFAAGNDGPTTGSIDAPASYPEAFGVGAVTSQDLIANFSSRGPSTWYGSNLIKPEVSAPGVNVRSSLPGGAYGENSGTSMATPHVAGLAALLLQADPSLTVDQIETIIKQTAVPLSSPIPNNTYGWGRIDAFAAVASLSGSGTLSGVVTRISDGLPIPGATLTAAPSTPDPPAITRTGDDGTYTLALAPDRYTLSASAFGYVSASRPVEILTDTTHTENFALAALPTGTLTGRVTSGGQPVVTASLSVIGTPVEITPDATGVYTAQLPGGSYTVTVTSPRHRVAVASAVPINAGEITLLDFELITAPTILLLDSGAWYYGSEIVYYRQALDELRYTYDLWTVHDPASDVPNAEDLLAYDIVFWSSPQDSPGYLDASDVLTNYLTSGGALFLSGQDVAYYDDYFPFISAPYFRNYLNARYVRDNTNVFNLMGVTGGLLDGLSFSIDGPGGANNQASPDEIRVLDPDFASSVVSYDQDGSGGQQVGQCLPYRAVYLSYGFEAIADLAVRTEVISRSIAWFLGPPTSVGVELRPETETRVGNFGHTVTHTLRIRNLAEVGHTTPFSITPSGFDWPTSLITDHVVLDPCESAQVELTVQVPTAAGWAASDAVTITAESATATKTAIRETRAPAPVLLVDDDRWYNVEDHYRDALEAYRIPYDEWQVPWSFSGGQPPSPPSATLQMYPIVLWFSAYDWYQPLTPAEEGRLAAYLDGGGRLYYNGQDYLFRTEGPNDFARMYLGVDAYTEDFTSTTVIGVVDSPVGSYLGPYEVNYPYKNFSDALTPTGSAEVAFVGQAGQPNAVTNTGPSPVAGEPPWRTAFFAFNPDGLDQEAAARLMQRVTGWLSWLGGSTIKADKALAHDSDTLTYTLVLRNDGWQDMANAYFTATFSSDLLPIPSSVSGGASWDPAQPAFVWSGPLARGQSLTFTYQAVITSPLPKGHLISHTVWMGYDSHTIKFDRVAATPVNRPDLSQSVFNANTSLAENGDTLTYTLQVSNTGVVDTLATAVNSLPDSLALVPGPLQISDGSTQTNGTVITWTVPVSAGETATLTYTAVVIRIPPGFTLTNRVLLDDGLVIIAKDAPVTVKGIPTFLPIVYK
ncbi:MAG: S8 family serine peptidase [Anaerolineales bacterium]|nr:MAG: S8 family serine peptidase [Anaerolineales bacterium]